MSKEFGGNFVNLVKEFFVNEPGKYFVLWFLLFDKYPTLVRYLATCSIVDSLVSFENFVNLGTLQPLGNSVCRM